MAKKLNIKVTIEDIQLPLQVSTPDEEKVYPLHMPGHKRQPLYDMDPFSMDITEIYGFDNLNHPESIYQDLNQRIAALYGADHAHLMVNGSTGGNYVMLHAATDVNASEAV